MEELQMKVTYGYQKPLTQRIREMEENLFNTFSTFEEEKLKVYFPFEHQFIGNLLNQETISKWTAGGYVIESQTGSGKSTLISTTLMPLAKARNKRVAIIVPRTALAMQYKKDLAKEYEPDLLGLLTDLGLQQHREFANADVYTMQEFINFDIRKEFEKKGYLYDFIILDEVHAFVGDAAFNPYTYSILEFLVSASVYGKRLYLTATTDIVLQEIVDMENAIIPDKYKYHRAGYASIKENVVLYRFRFDYNFLTVVLFTKENSGIEELKKTQEGEKTLIFVHSKAKGMKLRDLLGKDRADYIDAQSKMLSELENFQYIISTGAFKKQFLIVTKFLDVGVNLLDETINRVFVFHQYKEEVVQMLGRKRIRESDKLELYLYVPNQNEIRSELDALENDFGRMNQDLHTYQSMKGCYNCLPIPLYAERQTASWNIKENYYARRLNTYHQQQLKALIEGLNSDYYEHYAEEVLSWFPQCKALKWLDRTQKSEIRDKIIAILEPIAGQEFEKVQAVQIAHDILRELNQTRRKEQENSMPLTVLKKLFLEHDIPYAFRNLSREGKKGFYVVERRYDWQ